VPLVAQLDPQGTDDASIINLLDQRVLRPNPQFFSYTLAKSALWTATQTMAQQLGPRIRVNGIAPGLVATKLTKVTTDNPERLAGSIARIPQGRLGTPEDMAGAVLFLASPLAAYVTGQTLIVDGGLSL
jgi:3-oxoacyl-[acyl-carrier protein] reductase